jgi:hypothetical protein
MSPEAPPNTELGKAVAKCVNSRGDDGVVTGVDLGYAEDYKDAKYCVTGWSAHACMGNYTYAALKKSEGDTVHCKSLDTDRSPVDIDCCARV